MKRKKHISQIRGAWWQRFRLFMLLTVGIVATGSAQTVSLYNAFSGPYSYEVIGGSLRSQPNSVSSTTLKASDATALSLPAGSTIIGAYLYWAGSGPTADNTVTLDGSSVTADRTFSTSYNNGGTMLYFFGAFKDVTSYVAGLGDPNKTYTFSGLTVNNGGSYATSSAVISGWALLVVHSDPAGVRRTINIYDGFEGYRGSQIILRPSNFYVPFGTVDGKMTHVTWEGDVENSAALNGYIEQLAFNGFELTDPLNPSANQFNSESNTLQPQKGSTYGVDIDTYDITSLLNPSDTTATSLYSSGGDLTILTLEVISISDTSNSDIAISKSYLRGGATVIAGDTLSYLLSVRNNGPDSTGIITVRDSLEAGAVMVSMQLGTGWTVDSSSRPVYVFTHSGVHAPNVTLPDIRMVVRTRYDAANYPTLRNVATASSPQFDRRPWNNASTSTITVLTPVFVASTKTFVNLNGTYPVAGDTLLYTITVRNTGNYNVSPANLNPITVIDSIPAGFTIVPGSLSPAGTVNGQVITFNPITTLNVGATTALTYRVKAGPAFAGNSSFTNIAHLRASTVDEVISSTVMPPPPMTIAKSFDPGKTRAGDVITVRMIVRNGSTSLPSTGTVVIDTLLTATGFTYVTNSVRINGVAQTDNNNYPTDSTRYLTGPARLIIGLTGTRAPGSSDTITYQITAGTAPRDIYNKAWVLNSQRSWDTSSAYVYIRANATGWLSGLSSLLPGQPASFTLIDRDLNTNTGSVQTFNDSVFVVRTNEWEPVALVETGVNTGIFVGSRATVYGATSNGNNNGTLAVLPGDTLLLTYRDAIDSSGATNQTRSGRTAVVGGTTATLVGTTTALPGDSIFYTLIDADLDRNPAVAESYTIPDTNKVTNERETITFVETGANTGIFTGKVATQFGTAAGTNFDGRFNVQALDSLVVRYRDTVNAAGQDGGWLSVRTNILGGATATLTATAQVVPWDSVRITLTDADLNTLSGTAEALVVRETNTATNEYQDVALVETGPSTGVFVGWLKTRYGLVRGDDNDGYIFVQQADQLQVTYVDVRQANGGPGTTKTATTTVLGGSPASLTAAPTPIFAGDSALVTVTDPDLNRNAASVETYALRDSNITTGEWEWVTVTETGINTGAFTGWVRTQFGASAGPSADGVFNAKAGDSLVVSYRDTVTTNGAPGTWLKAGTGFKGGYNASLSATGNVRPGDSILVTIVDRDLNRLAASVESYAVRDSNRATGEWESLTVVETGVNTGTFTAWLRTAFGLSAGTSNDGTMSAKAGDTLLVTYRDSLRANGTALTLSATTAVRGGANAVLSMTATIVPSDSIQVRVTDRDLNTQPAVIESYIIVDSNIVTGEWESIVMTESGVNDSTFIGWVRTAFGAGAGLDNDGIFLVKSGDSLVARYRDTLLANGGPGSWSVSSTRVLGGATATLSAVPAPISPADSTMVTFFDPDLNRSPATIESYLLTLTSTTGEVESLRFVESGVNSGIFTRLVGTTIGPGPGASGDSLFAVSSGDTLRAVYVDSLTAAGNRDSLAISVAIVSADLTTSFKSLTDLNGGAVMPPDTIEYVLHVRNTGVARARWIAITDTLPADVRPLASTLPAGASIAGNVITFAPFHLTSGDSTLLTYAAVVDSSVQSQVPAVNRARIAAHGTWTLVTASFTPLNRPLMSFAKSVDRTSARPGDTLTYTMTYGNIGTSVATMVIVTDGIPLETDYIPDSVTLNGASKLDALAGDEVVVAGGMVTVSVGTVLPGATGTITFRVRIQ